MGNGNGWGRVIPWAAQSAGLLASVNLHCAGGDTRTSVDSGIQTAPSEGAVGVVAGTPAESSVEGASDDRIAYDRTTCLVFYGCRSCW